MQNAAKISPTNFWVTSVLGTKRERDETTWDETARGRNIEIIDIECVLLSFLSEKFVSTKWRIYKGILVGPRLLRRGISRRCSECEFTELFFQSLQKN
jgi:hypothetical protein